MKKSFVIGILMVLVFGLSSFVIGSPFIDGPTKDPISEDLDVDISVAKWARFYIKGPLTLDIEDPTEDEQFDSVEWRLHANTRTKVTFESLNDDLPEFFEYRASFRHGGVHFHYFSGGEKTSRSSNYNAAWMGGNTGHLRITYSHQDLGENQYMPVPWEGWEGLEAGDYSDTIVVTIEAN